MRKSVVLICGMALIISLLPISAASNQITVGLLAQNLSDNRTRVQRDAFWSQHRGARVSLDGRVTDVKPRGWIMPMTVEISTSNRNVTISCQIVESDESIAASLNVGDRVSCNGTLRDYVLIFGTLSLTVADSTVSR